MKNTVKKLVVDVLVAEYKDDDALYQELIANRAFKWAQAHENEEWDETKANNLVWTIEDEVNGAMFEW